MKIGMIFSLYCTSISHTILKEYLKNLGDWGYQKVARYIITNTRN